MSSFWRRLFGRRTHPSGPEDPAPSSEEPPARASEEDEQRLIQFAPDRGQGLPAQRRLQELYDQLRPAGAATAEEIAEIQAQLRELAGAGEEPMALELLTSFVSLLPEAPALRLHLAELHLDRRELDQALALLEPLTAAPTCRLRAHYLLGEHHAQEGELKRALTHYEAALALDFTYPRVHRRVQAIRRQIGDAPQAALPTLFGAEDLGAGARYSLQRELGRGGWGTVYLAHDRQLGRPVAVKMLHPHVRQRPAACLHLFCEARIAASLRHPGIIAIYDLDETLALIVMEHCPGGTLADRIARGPLPPHLALGVLAGLAEILDTVHRRGVLHRDIKPANLLSRGQGTDSAWGPSPAGSLVLSDFGIAHVEGEETEGVGGSGSLIYMSPEQRQGAGDDPRSDLFSSGVLLLEMLLGRPPLTPAEARQGVPLTELDLLWREVGELFGPFLRPPLLRLARGLVAPHAEHRPADASTLRDQTTALAAAAAQYHRDRQLLGITGKSLAPDQEAQLEAWLEELDA